MFVVYCTRRRAAKREEGGGKKEEWERKGKGERKG